MTSWNEEHCWQQPEELEVIGKDLLIQRRNIRKVEHEADEQAGTPAYEEYVCESREISVSEYEMLKSVEDIDSQKAIDDYTVQLIEEGLL